MPKFSKKPVEIDAFCWTGDDLQEKDPPWIVDAFIRGNVYFNFGKLRIMTPEGEMTAQPGDWIIKGVKGEIYPCKPDIFEATYEIIES
jgi:hypothetical protein